LLKADQGAVCDTWAES